MPHNFPEVSIVGEHCGELKGSSLPISAPFSDMNGDLIPQNLPVQSCQQYMIPHLSPVSDDELLNG